MYYLNHVGYKVSTLDYEIEPFSEYYLNHVGYKDFAGVLLDVSF
mgnify:CR=1 FL=1